MPMIGLSAASAHPQYETILPPRALNAASSGCGFRIELMRVMRSGSALKLKFDQLYAGSCVSKAKYFMYDSPNNVSTVDEAPPGQNSQGMAAVGSSTPWYCGK